MVDNLAFLVTKGLAVQVVENICDLKLRSKPPAIMDPRESFRNGILCMDTVVPPLRQLQRGLLLFCRVPTDQYLLIFLLVLAGFPMKECLTRDLNNTTERPK
jgi:hypothetical protein